VEAVGEADDGFAGEGEVAGGGGSDGAVGESGGWTLVEQGAVAGVEGEVFGEGEFGRGAEDGGGAIGVGDGHGAQIGACGEKREEACPGFGSGGDAVVVRPLDDVGSGEFVGVLIDDVSVAAACGQRVGVFEGGLRVGRGDAVAKPGTELLMEGREGPNGWGGRLGQGCNDGAGSGALISGEGARGSEVGKNGEGEVGGVVVMGVRGSKAAECSGGSGRRGGERRRLLGGACG